MELKKITAFCDRVTEYSFYAALAAVTFSISFTEIAVFTMIVSWIIKKVLDRDLAPFKTVPAMVFGLFILWCALSTLNSGYFSESARGMIKVLKYGAVFLVLCDLGKKDIVKRSVIVLLCSVVVVCVDGFFQYFTGADFLRDRHLTVNDDLNRISASFRHANDFAAYLVVVCLIILSFITAKKQRARNVLLLLGVLVLSLASLYLTQSRGAWISFFIALVVLGALRSRKLFFGVTAVVLILCVFPQVNQRMIALAKKDGGSGWERVMLWRGAVEMVKVHPFLGFGVNTYSRSFPEYKPKNYPDLRYTHNCYLQMATEVGIVGAGIFLLFIFSVLAASAKRIKKMAEGVSKEMAVGLFCGTIGFLLNSAVDTHLYSVVLAVFFYMLFGFLYGLTGRDSGRQIQ